MPAQHTDIALNKIQVLNWLLMIALTVAGWIAFSDFVALSILAGGVIANVSFWCLKRDITKLFGGSLQAVKVRFFIRYYVRFTILVALLYFLVSSLHIHVMGLLVGLSTVFFSIAVTVAEEAKKIFFNLKEAS